MEFKEIIKRALFIRNKYVELERKRYRREWTKENIAQGLVGDVGDLMKLVMAKDGIREIDKVDVKLAHELSDCLWSIIILAQEYNIDLEQSFIKTMDEIEKHIAEKMQEEKVA